MFWANHCKSLKITIYVYCVIAQIWVIYDDDDDDDVCLGEKKVFRLKHASTKFNIFNIVGHLDILW